ncbi:hypothetical protein B0A55_03714 [Friedmanniomyces simplex]|uniref:Uncharacterized protein n=1 Tax=Friedmanniomyces simplex TaxID=329884 RepID=A0A4U0XL02_9PEZI|nr:hypothetical protein B0A55_03714 [Friedmanniomyces simplex]
MSAKDGKVLEDYDIIYADQTIQADRDAHTKARRKSAEAKGRSTDEANKKLDEITFDPTIPYNNIPGDILHMITAMQALESAYEATTWRVGGPEFRADCARLDDWAKTLKGKLPGRVAAPNFTELPAKNAGKDEVRAFVVEKLGEAVAELKAGGRHAMAEELEKDFPGEYKGTVW